MGEDFTVKKIQNFTFKPIIYTRNIAPANSNFFRMRRFSWQGINWVSVERHVYKMQRVIYLRSRENGQLLLSRRKVWEIQKMFLLTVSSKLLTVRYVLHSFWWSPNGFFKTISAWKLGLVFFVECYQASNEFLLQKSSVGCSFKFGIIAQFQQELLLLGLEPDYKARYACRAYSLWKRPVAVVGELCKAISSGFKFACKLNVLRGVTVDLLSLISQLDTFSKARYQIRSWLNKQFFGCREEFFSSVHKFFPNSIFSLVVEVFFCELESRLRKRMGFLFTCVPFNSKYGLLVSDYRSELVVLHVNRRAVNITRLHIFMQLQSWCFNVHRGALQAHFPALGRYLVCDLGFNFLGFFLKYNSSVCGLSSKKFLVSAQPSLNFIKKLLTQVKSVLARCSSIERALTQITLVSKKWLQYYRPIVLTTSMRKHLLYQLRCKLVHWLFKKHGRKGKKKVYSRYIKFVIDEFRFC